MLVAALLASVVAQSGLGGTSALGANPKVFTSPSTGIKMKYPAAWPSVDEKRLSKEETDGLSEFGRSLKFVGYDPVEKWPVKFSLMVDNENRKYMAGLLSQKNNPWDDPTNEHFLPNAFDFGKGRYYVSIGKRKALVSFSMTFSEISIYLRTWQATAFVVDAKGKCYDFQMDFTEPGSKEDDSHAHAGDVMKREYPIFVEMLKSVSFE